MSSIKLNLAANLVGRVWPAAIAILLVPQYIKYLGIESYGLIGFYSTLIGSMAILDFGLSTTLHRELSKYKVENRTAKDIRNLTFSLECIYWAIGIIISLGVICLSWFIANHWVIVEELPISVVKQSIMLMGAVVAFQWPISLYDGGLRGLNEPILNNSIAIVMSTLRAAGVIIILKFYSPTLIAFFVWQVVLSFFYVLVIRSGLWKKMPLHSERPKFSKSQIKIIWRFAAGMTTISAITFFLAQIDKIVLSKLLSLTEFGYYTLAFTIATSITIIVNPIGISFFPRFNELVAGKREQELKELYHKACRLMATFIFPICFVLIFFTHDLLLIWTKNTVITENTYIMAQILIVGSMFNALMVIPYFIIIANGWTKFIFYQNVIAAIILVPMLFVWTNLYGALGATFVWLSVNAGYIVFSQPLMHRRILKNELLRWYWNDFLLPMIPSLLTVLLIKFSLQYFIPGLQLSLLILGSVFALSFISSVIMAPDLRILLKRQFNLLQHGGK